MLLKESVDGIVTGYSNVACVVAVCYTYLVGVVYASGSVTVWPCYDMRCVVCFFPCSGKCVVLRRICCQIIGPYIVRCIISSEVGAI